MLTNPQRRAFTLIELLVVIGIIGVLLAVLLPTLAKVRQGGKQTVELSAGRQLVAAYLLYANDNRGALITGYVLNDIYLRGHDDRGNVLTGEPVKRWPWRLMPTIKYGLRGTILVNEQADSFNGRDRNPADWAYGVSLGSSLALNLHGLGGTYNATTRVTTPAWACRKVSQPSRPSRRIVFVSGRGIGTEAGTRPGYWQAYPPFMPSPASATGWSTEPFNPIGPAEKWGFVDARWNGRAIVACLDGHAEAMSFEDLRDMTRWAQPADAAGDARWTP